MRCLKQIDRMLGANVAGVRMIPRQREALQRCDLQVGSWAGNAGHTSCTSRPSRSEIARAVADSSRGPRRSVVGEGREVVMTAGRARGTVTG